MSATAVDQGVLSESVSLGLSGVSGSTAGVGRYVVVEINGSQYGIITDVTVELMAASSIPVTRVPKSPGYVKGVINHRGSIIPVVCTRALLGLQTAESESRQLIDTLRAREQDHVAWLDALERSVRTGEKFDKQTDPSLCAFGRWYGELIADPKKMQQITRYDQSLRGMLADIDVPHKRTHRLATELLEMRSSQGKEAALQRLAEFRDTDFEDMRRLFGRMIETISKGYRMMLVITELGDRKAGFVVDAVHTVKDCAEDDIDVLPDSATGGEFLRGLVHQPDGGYILICDIERMYELACPR